MSVPRPSYQRAGKVGAEAFTMGDIVIRVVSTREILGSIGVTLKCEIKDNAGVVQFDIEPQEVLIGGTLTLKCPQ